MRVLTLNVKHFLPAATAADAGSRASRRTVRRAAAEIAELAPDVVLLQEVDKRHPRSGGVDQAGALAGALGMRHRFAANLVFGPAGLAVPAPRSEVSRGYGLALLSRYPVRSWHVRPLRGSGLRRVGPWWTARGWWPDVDRVFLAGVLLTEVGPVSVGVAHLSVMVDTARGQLATCLDSMRTLPGPALLGGDLNLPPSRVAPLATGYSSLATAHTFTNARPRKQIDHLLGAGLVADGPGRAHHFSVSDHAGLSADVTLVS
ncbi:endonuclease/exonuclease/phosphatase family protein [Georgenia deserti]|uniref:Endonuclease/exonuclease/phosphatase family protein n=1 Tax=Georgenia deserti TaxID=2093781 RepID=A0ABW4KYT8_9MICO